MIARGLCHIQIRDNTICEGKVSGFCDIKHVGGKVSLISNLFTKADCDVGRFNLIMDAITTKSPESIVKAKRMYVNLKRVHMNILSHLSHIASNTTLKS